LKLEETIDIRADAAKVWSFIGDVSQWPYFVTKISKATAMTGKLYEFQHEKGPIQGELLDERTEKEIGVKLQIKGRGAIIRYTLEEKDDVCRVTEIQEFHIPFPINLLISWIHRTGKKTGDSNLDNLKRLVESTF
jgi:Polyketide cyclase / dehydrase and lipid transport